ncbi:glycosyltransferase family 2 protein [Candidatus Thiothrix sp. Deng01]|uniref:Glycosyltransferase family 2 protein n=1 Tax=Candidatus Thiothrix phosphatis TaxID=3112415 RepID=A0ABU6CYP3_9GAMM|nr:glycosyltransferase family 2 protein [Candidatus Thiothrix sp. Deng01]MEB4591202.1 glycosyltransferase family 2 protein [Candidatus Thiothrix sp. Deng01]
MTNYADSVSIIVPFYNEEDNVLPLVERVTQALENMAYPWEMVLVDDGSSDHTLQRLHEASTKSGNHIHVVELQRNFGQTAAMQAGIDQSRGSLLVTLDGDLQNDPNDIPAMLQELQERDLDLLVGWRKNRKDTLVLRKIPSRIANRLIRKVTGVYLHDYGCSLKVYRASVMEKVRLYGEMHRFIPAWVATAVPPSRIGERVVNHNERLSGESKYGISRTFRVIIDLLFMWFFMRFRARPGHLFGTIGLAFGLIGSLILSWLGMDKFILGHDIGGRPLLLAGVMLMITSIQFLTTGIIAELLARVYFESSSRNAYVIRAPREDNAAHGWKQST